MSTSPIAFRDALLSARRILIVCGAGLSASSGLPTFRGAGGLWRTYSAQSLATPGAFAADPALVLQFYAMRRAAALRARPNAAHYALARLAALRPPEATLCLSQNVDGLSKRAGHRSMEELHGSLMVSRCAKGCGFEKRDEVVEVLKGPEGDTEGEGEEWPFVPVEALPRCPECGALMRPGVVWFGEDLDKDLTDRVDKWIEEGVDLCIVVGTSGQVYPAAGYSEKVKRSGGRVAVVDLEARGEDMDVDWMFVGDAAKVLPEILKPVIGKVVVPE